MVQRAADAEFTGEFLYKVFVCFVLVLFPEFLLKKESDSIQFKGRIDYLDGIKLL